MEGVVKYLPFLYICRMDKYIVILDNGHGVNTTGKCSPDKSLREYAYAREIVRRIANSLDNIRGYKAEILVPEAADIGLSIRVQRANAIYSKYKGKAKVILISVHCNAAPPNDSKWHSAMGWSAFTSVGQTESDRVCKNLYDAAEVYLAPYVSSFPEGTSQRPIRSTKNPSKGWEENFTILKKTNCPAVLTENLFQDNKYDVDFLLSEGGKKAITNLHVAGIVKYMEGLSVVPSIIDG